MDQIFEYRSVKGWSEGLYKEKGSKFVGYAFPCSNEAEFSRALNEVKTEHHTARHHCYAYAFGPDGSTYRANDDGEPSGTAGRPIHGQIRSCELSDVGIVVVRYFGGTKLGASGLIRSYKAAAKDALDQAKIVVVELKERLKIQFRPEDTGVVMRFLDNANAVIKERSFDKGLSGIECVVAKSHEGPLRTALEQIQAVSIS